MGHHGARLRRRTPGARRAEGSLSTVRLTVGQAIVRFLAPSTWSATASGTGSSPASGGSSATATSRALGRRWRSSATSTAAVLPAAERAGPGPHRDGVRQAQQPAPGVRLHLVHRPRRDQHDHRRRDARPSTACRSSCCPRTTSRTAPPDPVLQQLEHPVRATSAPTTPSDRSPATSTASPARSSCCSPARGVPRPHRPGRDRRRDDRLPEDVQAEACDWPERSSSQRVWRIRRPQPGAAGHRTTSSALRVAERPLIVAGGGAIYAARPTSSTRSPTRFGIPVGREPGGQGRPALEPCAERRADRGARAAWPPTGSPRCRPRDRRRDPPRRLRDRLADRVPGPGRAVHRHQRRPVRRPKPRAIPLVADAREALTALAAALDAAGWTGTTPGYRDRVGDPRRQLGRTVDGRPSARRQATPTISASPSHRHRQRRGRRPRDRDLRGGLPARRPAQAVAPRGPRRLPPRVRLLVHGLRDPGRHRREDGGAGRDVVVAIGDGTYLMLNSEIVTAVAEGIAITIVVSRQPRLPVHHDLAWSAGVPRFGNELRFRDPARNRLDAATTSRSTSRSTPRRWAPSGSSPGRPTRSAPRSTGASATAGSGDPRPGLPDKRAPGLRGLVGRAAAAVSGQKTVDRRTRQV